jgi:uncharacterized membrane protein
VSPIVAEGRHIERWTLGVLATFTAIAVVGYWNFVVHPERLPTTPLAVRFYSVSFELFARLHIVLAASALAVVLVSQVRGRWLPALLAVYAVAFVAEHVGTGYGVPFGAYGYTGLLGPKLGGRVPVLIPLSWFLMALPAWVVARAVAPSQGLRAVRVALGALWLVAWDLALDPAMSFLTPYWHWDDAGPYYGMPLGNLLGWFITGVVLMTVLDTLSFRLGLGEISARWMAAYYGTVLLMPLGMAAAAGLGVAVMTTLGALGLCALLTWGVPWSAFSRRPDLTPESARLAKSGEAV